MTTMIDAHPTVADRAERGKAARAAVPRAAHATADLPDRDPVALLEAQAPSRVPELVPIRYGRMLASPFAFFRGAAAVMAHDLAALPSTSLHTQLCGDAHLANFGGFASPERSFVFDLNDFDETLPGPFEWDVKRLVASVEIAARNREFDDAQRAQVVLASVRSYREAMRRFATMGNLQVWYARLNVADIAARLRAQRDAKQARSLALMAARAHTRDSMRAFRKLTHLVDGEPRIISDPPLIVPVEELVELASDRQRLEDTVHGVLREYTSTIQHDRRQLLATYRVAHLARKVVGVGSVGTLCWIALMIGRDTDDPLFLQVKEAQSSVLEPYLGHSEFEHHGRRVVEGQRLMQASSDIFLGWYRSDRYDGRERDFFVRQLWDWKVSANLETILPRGLVRYAEACGWSLARAHARGGDRIAIAEYLGKGDAFDRALAAFASAYADQNERDYDALLRTARAARIQVHEGV